MFRDQVNRMAVLLSMAIVVSLAGPAQGQDSSLLQRNNVGDGPSHLTLEDSSFLYQKPEPPKTLELFDIVTVVVNFNSRVLSEGEVQNRKTGSYNAVLNDWIRLDRARLRPDRQSEGDPTIDGSLSSQYRALSELETRGSLNFTIAAQIIEERPNGTLVLQARREIRSNEEVWEQSLLGTVRREDISPDNKVELEDVAELRIDTRESGHVRDSYRRGWLQKFFAKIQPF